MQNYKAPDGSIHFLDDPAFEHLLPEGSVKVSTADAEASRTMPSYAALRQAEYPPMADYLDGIVKGDQAQVDAYIAACQAVKAKYQKP